MPQPNRTTPFPLSKLNDACELVRVRCAYCKQLHNYYPTDLIQLFGDVDVDSLAGRMVCENAKTGTHGYLEVSRLVPTAGEAVGLKIRKLVAIKIRREPVWREE